MNYKVTYKRFGFPWSKTVEVCGHKYDSKLDRMDLFLPNDKGIVSIGNWKNYTLYLGEDFIKEQKRQAEEEAGRPLSYKQNR